MAAERSRLLHRIWGFFCIRILVSRRTGILCSTNYDEKGFMVIVDFYTSDNQKHWLNEIKRSDWNAGKFLYPDVGPIAG